MDPIKEDKDDDYCKYNEDFEPSDLEDLKSVGLNIVNSKQLLELLQLNPKSAEPHLHKSKALNLQPLAELSNLDHNVLKTPMPHHSAN